MFQEFLSRQFWGNSGQDYLMVLIIFVAAILVLKIFQLIIVAWLKRLAKKTATDFDDVLVEIFEKLKPPFYVLVALYIGVLRLNLETAVNKVIQVIFFLAILYELNGALRKLVQYALKRGIKKRTSRDEFKSNKDYEAEIQSQSSMINIVAGITSFVVWSLGFLLILSNLGVDITSLIAGLGIGGIAVALALQNILSDIFSSISIIADKPFKVGDFIVIGSDMGTVERVGIKTTRIRTLQGQELTVSNKELTSLRINNYGRMEKRRVVFEMGVIYETEKEKLERIPALIKKIIEDIDKAEFDRSHFKRYGDFSLIFESVYYILSADYNEYMDIQQQVNLGIFDAFRKEKIGFAYPTSVEYQKKV
jgi:small-conductance mechanosensitive channel